jgi:hypothetical protein
MTTNYFATAEESTSVVRESSTQSAKQQKPDKKGRWTKDDLIMIAFIALFVIGGLFAFIITIVRE